MNRNSNDAVSYSFLGKRSARLVFSFYPRENNFTTRFCSLVKQKASILLPKWVIKKIDQIRRKFLWHGHRDQTAQAKGIYMVNWSMATRPRKLGGLGIRDIQATNHALLMKWLWKWHDRTDNWWKEATPMLTPSDKPWNDTHSSVFWKSLRQVALAFDSSVAYKIGNGDTIKLWHDNWHGTPLKILYPNLYQAASEKQISISQYKNAVGWPFQFTSLPPTAQAEKDQLMNCLQSLQSDNSTQQQDEIVWLRDPKSFSVKSIYKLLTYTPGPNTPIANIWQLKAPLRVLIFAWLLLTNRLPTIDNLTRRGWHLTNMCVMCKENEETVHHLFQNCKVAKEVRSYIYAAFADRLYLPQKFNTVTSTQLIADPTEHNNARECELTTCFIIWRERCRRIFMEKELPQISIVREVHTEWKAWFQHTVH